MKARVARLLPILDWLPRYDRGWLRGDVGSRDRGDRADRAEEPRLRGHRRDPGRERALRRRSRARSSTRSSARRGTSRPGRAPRLQPSRVGQCSSTGVGGDEAAQLVAAITLVTGALFLLLAAFRLGWIAQFLSKAVVTGFLAGAAVDVVVGELPKLTGTSSDGDNVWQRARRRGCAGSTTSTGRRCSSAWSRSAVILALRFTAPAVPGALVLVVGGLLASWLFDLGAHGVALVGDVPRGLAVTRAAGAGISSATTRGDLRRRRRAPPDRLLADGRRRARLRHAPPLPHRRQPGVGRAGHGQRRRRRLPGHARLDEPFGELAERVGRRAHARRVARHGRARAGDADRARTGLLGACRRPCSARSSSTRSSSG